MSYSHSVGAVVYRFEDMKALLARATPARSGDDLAGLSARCAEERVAAQMALADLPLKTFLDDLVIPYELDEVTRLIVDSHDSPAFANISHLTVGEFRDWLLSDDATPDALGTLAPGLMPEMAAAVSKTMRLQDLITVSAKIRVVTRFRSTVGLPGRLSTRLQPNHPADDPTAIAAAIIDGLLLGSGDAVIGINPASDNVQSVIALLRLIENLRTTLRIPVQSCVLAHITTQMEALRRGAPVDLLFQSIAGTEAANASFGINLALLEEARQAALELHRGDAGSHHVMYFETGQGSALSANAHHGVDQQTCEARAYAVARRFQPMLVNTVVGFIGPEYLCNGKQITRAGLEDHFCGKLLGLPMGCDVCYTNHAEADQDDMDSLLTLLGAAGVNYIMGVPGADDVMLNYQSTSFHDALYLRALLNLRPAPEFEAWMEEGRRKLPAVRGAARVMTDLRHFTLARVGLGRTGNSLPTRALLDFQLAHARARDAVHYPLDAPSLCREFETAGLPALTVKTVARDRHEYLRRPDFGRTLDPQSRERLQRISGPHDVVFVVADGLSPRAVHRHAAGLLRQTLPGLDPGVWNIAPAVIVEQGRVAVADEIGKILNALIAVILIGERPGLSSPDSLGVYLTWSPAPGRTDAERNCISNIHSDGLSTGAAAELLLLLMRESRAKRISGIKLGAGIIVLAE